MKIIVESWEGKFHRFKPLIKKTALRLARFLDKKYFHLEIYLVGSSFMNKNVLAFPAPKGFPRPDIGKKYKCLGEIYLNPDYIKKEKLPPRLAGRASPILGGKIPAKLVYMLIHGFLHLLGYDHKKKGDRIRMVKREAELLSKLT